MNFAKLRVNRLKTKNESCMKASAHCEHKLKLQVLKVLKDNVDSVKCSRKNCELLENSNEVKAHLRILERFNFWEITPVEGKYAMAVAFHKKRL